MFKRIDHVEIVPSNPERTINFYTSILGFEIRSRHEVAIPPMREVVYLELGDTVIEIIVADGPSPRSESHWQVGYRGIALDVDDMAEAVNYLKDNRVVIAREPIDLGDSFRAEIRDPDHLLIELRQWK